MQSLRALPLPVRWTVVGATAGVLFGCVLGLVVGLVVHWQTAWFAVFELGVPASILGGFSDWHAEPIWNRGEAAGCRWPESFFQLSRERC